MKNTVIGIFDDFNNAQKAAQNLMTKGFIKEKIDVSNKDNRQNYEKTTPTRENDDDSIGNFFNNLFGTNDESERYAKVARNKSVITVHTASKDEAERAANILDDCGAIDVDQDAGKYQEKNTGIYQENNRTAGNNMTPGNENTTIPVIEEDVEIGKRVVETGGVRIRSRIVERPVEESLRLREEHVNLERNDVNRVATKAELANFKEGTVEVTERAEVPMVAKEARVVEEINIGKEVNERQETVREAARSTKVEVENLEVENSERYNRNR